MSQLILDLSDPAVAEMVSQWEDEGVYRVELIIQQKPGTGNLKPFNVQEIIDYGDSETGAAPTGQGLKALTPAPDGPVGGAAPPAVT